MKTKSALIEARSKNVVIQAKGNLNRMCTSTAQKEFPCVAAKETTTEGLSKNVEDSVKITTASRNSQFAPFKDSQLKCSLFKKHVALRSYIIICKPTSIETMVCRTRIQNQTIFQDTVPASALSPQILSVSLEVKSTSILKLEKICGYAITVKHFRNSKPIKSLMQENFQLMYPGKKAADSSPEKCFLGTLAVEIQGTNPA